LMEDTWEKDLDFRLSKRSLEFFKIHTCYSEEQVISVLEFLIDNICVSFGGTLFQQVVGIAMGTNCAPLLADLFLFSYESEFRQKLVKDKKIYEARAAAHIWKNYDFEIEVVPFIIKFSTELSTVVKFEV
jgi:hypothetical protein